MRGAPTGRWNNPPGLTTMRKARTMADDIHSDFPSPAKRDYHSGWVKAALAFEARAEGSDDDECEALVEEASVLFGRVITTPARSLAGIRATLKAAEAQDLAGCEELADQLLERARADLVEFMRHRGD